MTTIYYYCDPAGNQLGPYTKEELERRHAMGELAVDGLLCEAGGDAWRPVAEVLDQLGAETGSEALPPPPPHRASLPVQQTVVPPPGQRPKCDRSTYILLGLLPGIFVGVFGIHNLLAGYIGRGLGQLALSALFWISVWFCVGFVFYIAGLVWTVIDCVQIEHDVNGVPMAV